MNAVAIKDAHYWLEWNLENWARWMSGGARPQGLPRSASGGLSNYTTLDVNNERAYGKLDAWAASATNAAIDDLKPIEQCAISNAYLCSVWRFRNVNQADVLASAKRNVVIGLRRRGIWLGE